MVGTNVDKLTDSNVSNHMKRKILQKGEECKRILFALLDANIQLTNNIVVSFIKSKWNTNSI